MTEQQRRIAMCSGEPKPTVGMGATIIVGSDRYPATVVEVSKSGHRIVVQNDDARRTDDRGLSEMQDWEIVRNPNGRKEVATRRKNGAYRIKGSSMRVLLGEQDCYRDPSF